MKNSAEAEKWYPSNDVKAFHAEYPEEGFNWLEFAEKYHQHIKEKELSSITDEVIQDAAFQKHKTEINSLDKRYGFICGATFIREYLKQKK